MAMRTLARRRRWRILSLAPFYMRMYIMRVIAVGMRGDLGGGEIGNLARFVGNLPKIPARDHDLQQLPIARGEGSLVLHPRPSTAICGPTLPPLYLVLTRAL